jgi:hypothetical protein
LGQRVRQAAIPAVGNNETILSRFLRDPRSVLGEILLLALVRVEPLLNIVLGRFDRHQAAGKLHVTVLADTEQGMVTHDPKVSLCHGISLSALQPG